MSVGNWNAALLPYSGSSSVPSFPGCGSMDFHTAQLGSVYMDTLAHYNSSSFTGGWGLGSFSGIYGSYGNWGSQTGFALDTTTANSVFSDNTDWGTLVDGGCKQLGLAFFNGAQNSVYAMASNPGFLWNAGKSLLGGFFDVGGSLFNAGGDWLTNLGGGDTSVG